MGWIILLCVIIGAVVTGAAISKRTATPGKKAAAAGIAGGISASPASFSTKDGYAHVSATSPEVTAAIAADDLDAGEKMIDKTIIFTGKVAKVYVTNSKSMTFLNFADNYKDAFSIMIQSKDYGKFPDPSTLKGKQLVVTGKAVAYQGKLEVVADSPLQIKIVDGVKSAPTSRP